MLYVFVGTDFARARPKSASCLIKMIRLFDDQEEEIAFDVAPYDIFTKHNSVGNIMVAKAGDCLPLTTKYKKKDPGNIPVKFVVSRNLDVEAVEFKSELN